MDISEEQTSLGCQVAVFGILESLVVGGILWFWGSLNGFTDFLPALPYVLGTLLLVQLVLAYFCVLAKSRK